MVVIMARWTMASWWSGSGLVVARAAAVLVDPRGTSLDHPNAGPDVETSGAGDAFDDLHSRGENVLRPDEQPSGVTAVGPRPARWWRSCRAVRPGVGVRRRGRGSRRR